MSKHVDRLTDGLRQYLQGLPPGPVEDIDHLERLLADCWDDLYGANQGGMRGYKLRNRMEEPIWEPPYLRFKVERHGGTAMGSTRAEIQHWVLDIPRAKVAIEKVGRRQVRKQAAGIPVKKMARELAEIILAGREDERIRYKRDGEVLLRIGEILPHGEDFKITVRGRRKRLLTYILEILQPNGWREAGLNSFRKQV